MHGSGANERFARTKQTIDADRLLSLEGKQEKLTAAREMANASIARLREGVEKANEAPRASLEIKLLAVPTTMLGSTTDNIATTASYRDAITRAGSTVTPAELLDLQNTAVMTGDKLLARATMVVGLRRGDIPVVDGFSAANPHLEADVDELFVMTHTSTRNAIGRSFAHEMAFAPV